MTVGERRRTTTAAAGRESLAAVHGFPVVIRPLTALSDDQFHEFCRLNVDGAPVLPGFRLDFRSIR